MVTYNLTNYLDQAEAAIALVRAIHDPSARTEANAERHHYDNCDPGCVWCENGAECPWCGGYLCWDHDHATGLSPAELQELAEERAADRQAERWAEL